MLDHLQLICDFLVSGNAVRSPVYVYVPFFFFGGGGGLERAEWLAHIVFSPSGEERRADSIPELPWSLWPLMSSTQIRSHV